MKFDSLDKIIITFPKSKVTSGRPVKGFITYLGLKDKARPNKCKKARYAIGNFSKKDISKIIREFEKLPYESYERKSPKHECTDSYFYLARQIAKCIMRDDSLNLHVYPVRTEMTATELIPTSHICSTDKIKLKEFLVDKTLLQICSMYKDELKGIIVDKFSSEEE